MRRAYYGQHGVEPARVGIFLWAQGQPRAGAIAYVDSLMGELLETLDNSGIANDTVVVVIGDHGESA
jgi:hypothetical protein